GGLFILIAAIALLAPLRVGGFEIMDSTTARDPRFAPASQGAGLRAGHDYAAHLADPAGRLLHWGTAVVPMYAGLTGVMWLALLLSGGGALESLIRAMGTISTSGIASVAGPVGRSCGIGAEAVVAVFLLFALSRRVWPGGA
ncbi:MAG TPA: TrkH family potassium uptake protein, partial [Paracoccus sp. (in: a-proteobacteria)]|nr:TrkH family potassium uptake protein [Paracoccus sp. (in: a-proteobacteria)]